MTDHPMLFSAPMVRAKRAGIKTQTRRIPGVGNTLFNGARWTKLAKAQEWDWDNAWVDAGPSPAGNPGPYLHLRWKSGDADPYEGTIHRIYPLYQPGDRIWVKENHYLTDDADEQYAVYAADEEEVSKHLGEMDLLKGKMSEELWRQHTKLRPSIHLPRLVSRLTLLVKQVRIERLQDISETDAQAEGMARVERNGCVGYEYWDDPKEEANGWSNKELYYWPTAIDSYCQLWGRINGRDSWNLNPWVIAITFDVVEKNIDEVRI